MLSSAFFQQSSLYGREKELQELRDIYNLASGNRTQFALIAGHSGIGKSSLVNKIQSELNGNEGVFIRGKQDQLERSLPYSTYLQAFKQLIRRWERKDEASLAKLKEELKAAVGNHAQLLLQVLPELAPYLGPADTPESIPPLEAQHRFNQVLIRFIEAVALHESPLVIFLDDLQWVDLASLQFTGLLVKQLDACPLLLIGAYRDNEVGEDHALTQITTRLREEHIRFPIIELDPLSIEAVDQWLSEQLNMTVEEIRPLSDVMHRISGGNPLFLKQYLRQLEDDQMLRRVGSKWQYNLQDFKNLEVLDDAVDFIVRMMKKFDEVTRELISIAAAIGTKFNLRSLALITNMNEPAVMQALVPVINQGSIIPRDENYKALLEASAEDTGLPVAQFQFTHDKMQQAAYSLCSKAELEEIHYRIGRSYRSALGHAATEFNVFEIVNQFNNCLRLVNSKDERKQLAELNLKAGEKAKASNAYDQGLNYFLTATELMESSDASNQTTMHHSLLQCAECAYLLNNPRKAKKFFDRALEFAVTPLEQAQVHAGLLTMYSSSSIDEAWESGLNALKALRVKFPTKPGKGRVLVQLLKLRRLIGKRSIDELLDGPDMTSEEARLALMVLMDLLSASWDRGPETLAMVVLKGFEITLVHGNAPVSYFGYSGYGAILGSGFGKIEKGWEYIRAGGTVTEKYDSMFFHGRGNYAVYGSYHHYVHHIKECIYPLEDTLMFSKEAGDYNCAAYSTMMIAESSHVIGTPLEQIIERSEEFLTFVQKIQNTDYAWFHRGLRWCAKELSGLSTYGDKEYQAVSRAMEDVRFTHCRAVFNVYLLQNHYLLGRHEEARKLLPSVEREAYSFALSTIEVKWLVYRHLVLLTMDSTSRKTVIKGVVEATKWAKSAPENYAQVEHLLRGALEMSKRHYREAIAQFELGIKHSKAHGFVQNEALMFELKSQAERADRSKEDAAQSQQNALLAYRKWGASAKCDQLKSADPS